MVFKLQHHLLYLKVVQPGEANSRWEDVEEERRGKHADKTAPGVEVATQQGRNRPAEHTQTNKHFIQLAIRTDKQKLKKCKKNM